ncbi:hypothetical protein VaNZ11_000670 [Volvox africanus]|uniref:Uncharacterized protein n=1 Tax=Volvox africanus TaxID=51714 RepID=A0ABQ5RN23_9CHLO|nr:hypothetical protein VaNZ11_000670 [Volvox africanus]
MAAGEELSRLEELLRRPDYVLEPAVKDNVRQYIKSGGKPEVILESLTEGYVGYAHMAMMMVKWMDMVEDEPLTNHDEFFYLKEFTKAKFDPDKFVGIFASQSTRSQGLPWLEGLLSDPRGRKFFYELSASHRNSLLLNFTIQKIMKMGYQDEVAAAGSGLASYFSVFHKLLENKIAALLAVVRRAAEAEAATGARGGGGGRCGAGALEAARAQAKQEVAALVKDLRDSCEQSQHTYLHVQHMLHYLGNQRGGEALMAVAQQLEADVAAGGPSLPVWSMQKLYAPQGSSAAQVEACNLIGRILQAGPEGTAASDVQRLYGLYSSASEEPVGSGGGGGGGGGGSAQRQGGSDGGAASAGALSTAPLQHPRLVQALLACIFNASRPPSSDLLAASAGLLARATCTRPMPIQPPKLTDTQQVASQQRQQPGAGSHVAEDPAGPAVATDRAGESQRIAETTQALHWAVGVLSRTHGRFTVEDFAMAPQLHRMPVVAHGLLHAVSCQLGSPAFYDDAAAAAAAVPSLLRISLWVAEWQPHLISRVLSSWSVALTELYRAGLGDLCRLLLDGCVALLKQQATAAAPCRYFEAVGPSGKTSGPSESGPAVPGGAVREVLDLVEAWSRQGSADPGLLRYFVLQVLAFASPPYSSDFCGAMLRLLLAAGMRATNVRNEAAAALLREFALAAEGLSASFTPPLTVREQHLLAELAASGGGLAPAQRGGA